MSKRTVQFNVKVTVNDGQFGAFERIARAEGTGRTRIRMVPKQ